jgi:hypothetical protein
MTATARRRRLFALLAVSLGLACVRVARADERPAPRVTLDLTGCDLAFAGEVRRIAGVELRAMVVEPDESHGAVTRTIVTCRDTVADLWVSDPVTAKLVLRTVSLAETSPRARARLIALAIAELVSASWEEVESNPEPRVPPATPTPPEERAIVRRALERPQRVAVDALGDARALLGSGVLLLGGAIRAAVRLGPPLTLRLQACTDVGSASTSLGDVAIQITHGSAGLGWAFDLGALDALLWAGALVGYARLAGEPNPSATGHVQSGPWAGPEAGIDILFWPREVAHLVLGLSGGAALLGVRGDVQGGESVGASGAWGALTLGVGISRH